MNNRFLHRVARVFFGTLGAQGIMLLSTLLLARLYSPAEMGLFNVWFAFLTVGAVMVTARYELAFFALKSDDESPALGRLIVYMSALLSLVLTVGLATAAFATAWLPAGIAPFILPLGIAVFVASLNTSLLSLLALQQRFTMLGMSRVGFAASVALLQILGGVLALGAAGLIYGQLLGSLLAVALIIACVDRRWLQAAWSTPRATLAQVRNAYRSFPIYSLPADLVNNVARQLPMLMVAARFGNEAGGWYGLTLKIMGAPISLLATSILDVFKEQAARDYRTKGNCLQIYKKTLLSLALVALPPFIILYFVGEYLFATLFGPQWQQSGKYAVLMIPMFYTGFVASPLSYTIYIAQKQKYDLIWQCTLLLISIAVFGLATDAETAIRWFSLLYAGMYCIYLFMSYYFARGTK